MNLIKALMICFFCSFVIVIVATVISIVVEV